MLEKLAALLDRYNEINERLMQPETAGNGELYRSLMKEYNQLTPIIDMYKAYLRADEAKSEAEELLKNETDPDFKLMAEEQLREAKDEIANTTEQLKLLLLPKDPNDSRNVIIEVRAGAGGEEAALFAGSLFRMYTMYSDTKRWKTEVLGANRTELGGFKEVSFSVEGAGAYSRFKYESGVHRVQRVPETESQGRIQTSTATVAVLPEAESVELNIDDKDLKIDVFRASGAGGQHINKTESAVRITHLPTGMVVECQDERSQQKNKDRAMKVLCSRLLEMKQEEQDKAIAGERRSQIGTGDRSERIRTYNFPEGRVSDHRIGLTLYKLDSILNGDLDEVIDALATADQAAKLAKQAGEI
ncbi:MAG: peptide chain release factor 1 [Oscillospiraceae bacterium]|nr:peptide chain release factor 1 [Oscillospiraceae bacterium]